MATVPSSSTPWTKPDTTTRPIAIIGAGVMGRRIAMMWVAAGYNIELCEKATHNHTEALDYIRNNQDAQAKKMGTKPGTVNITTCLDDACSNAWMVIEAVPEKLEMKIEILGYIDAAAPGDCVVTTNSSSLRSSQMLANTKHNYRICNGHYYMPPEQCFYEVMSCGQTDEEIPGFLMEKSKTAGFQPVQAKEESTGLVFNRIWAGIKREVLLCMADGVSDAKTIDAMFKSWFVAQKGPCQMMDTVGLDTVYNIEAVYQEQLGLNPKVKDWLKATYVDKGNLGNKSGKGLLS
ncbi:hypothetical protein N7454_009916 [Penicillium verhagenii]|nr:hypothetical protein N7454_009916 [Penicillium verhagenii]